MHRWSPGFLLDALVSGALGFTEIAGAAAGFARLMFPVFLALYVLSPIFSRKPAAA